MSNSIVTYEPDNSLKKGYLTIFKEIYHELKWNKWLTFQLFKRDFFGMYKQSFVGFFWAFIMPFLSLGTFILLNNSGVFSVGDINVPYPVYALIGITYWQIFAIGISSCVNSLTNAGSMITKINFSKKSLVIASIGKPIVIFLIQCLLIIALLALYRIIPSRGALLAPLVLIPLILFVTGLGFTLSLFNSFVKDIGNGLPVITTFLMFLTPVLYAKPTTGTLAHITKFNPLFYLISGARDLILKGTISEVKGFIISICISIIIFSISLFIFHLTETRVAERI